MIFYDTLSIIIHLKIFNIVLTRAQPLPIFKARKAGLLYRHRKIPKLACEPTIVDEVCPFQLNLSNQAKLSNIDLLQQDIPLPDTNVAKMLVGRRLLFLLGPEATKDASILMQRHESRICHGIHFKEPEKKHLYINHDDMMIENYDTLY